MVQKWPIFDLQRKMMECKGNDLLKTRNGKRSTIDEMRIIIKSPSKIHPPIVTSTRQFCSAKHLIKNVCVCMTGC